MIGIVLKTAKKNFLDTRKIQNRILRAELRLVGMVGSFTRRKAKSSIRKRKRISNPGEPPSSHTGLLKNFIFFFVNKEEKSVVTGPILLDGTKNGGDAPRLLEHGGDAVRRRASLKKGMREKGELRTVRYAPRPYMQPAFETSVPEAMAKVAGSVRE